jgi:hypothetical protein
VSPDPAAIAIIIIALVRGLPDKEEREAAEGGALPIIGAPSLSQDGHREGRPPSATATRHRQ